MVALPDASVTTVLPSMLNRIPGSAGTVFTTRVTGWSAGSTGADGFDSSVTLGVPAGSADASAAVGEPLAATMARAAVTAAATRRMLMSIASGGAPVDADRDRPASTFSGSTVTPPP